ncbi:MAG: hypothetical protein ABI833_02985 [Acidobacteriota bacterium]
MKRYILLVVLGSIAAAQLFAEAPKGWKMRVDRSTSAADPDTVGAIRFDTSGAGFHAVNPQAAVYWNPANVAGGAYTIKAAFTLLKPSSHPNYYGLIFGGSDLEGAQQTYLYFVIAQDGTWLLKHRTGDGKTENLSPDTPNDAVKKPDSNGKSTNLLEVRVGADKVDYLVNGTMVHTTPKAGLKTDGIYGIRINHVLDVQIDGFAMSK